MNQPDPTVVAALHARVASHLDFARAAVARSVHSSMVLAYWRSGRDIVEVEQAGQRRAAYGAALLDGLSARLRRSHGRGFGVATLRRIRAFYLTFPAGFIPGDAPAQIRSTPLIESADTPPFPASLGWSHYLLLMGVKDESARSFYAIECGRASWSVDELERQIDAMLFERLSMRKGKGAAARLAAHGQEVTTPGDVIKDPFVLEFLDLAEVPELRESHIEAAIIDRLETFLLELGKGFCFVGRQKRFTIEADHFYVDLVFYNRLLRCFVLIDLKLGKLVHQDLGQMQMYVNYFDRFERADHEAPTVGIVLCSSKNEAVVRLTLPEGERQIIAAKYQFGLPTEEELRAELERERREVETLMLTTRPPDGTT